MTRLKGLVLAAAIAAAAVASPTDTAAPLKDGTWAGPRVKVVHGYLRVDAVVSGGALTEVRIREYPDQDKNSRHLNGIALSYLVKSALSKGSAQVDTVSGATMTSKAFAQSLEAALAAAAR